MIFHKGSPEVWESIIKSEKVNIFYSDEVHRYIKYVEQEFLEYLDDCLAENHTMKTTNNR